MNFFIKNPNLTTKKYSGGWEGRGWGVARVSDFLFFQKNPSPKKKEKKKKFFFEGGLR